MVDVAVRVTGEREDLVFENCDLLANALSLHPADAVRFPERSERALFMETDTISAFAGTTGIYSERCSMPGGPDRSIGVNWQGEV